MQGNYILITSLFVAIAATGCARKAQEPGSPVERRPQAVQDCVSPFIFEGREYLLAMGSDVPSVEPGGHLGKGAYESCAQYSGGSTRPLAEPRSVYRLPGAPSEQAIVLTNADGQGTVLLAAERPDNGWDRDLRRWALLVD
jgi:hypothetical protein